MQLTSSIFTYRAFPKSRDSSFHAMLTWCLYQSLQPSLRKPLLAPNWLMCWNLLFICLSSQFTLTFREFFCVYVRVHSPVLEILSQQKALAPNWPICLRMREPNLSAEDYYQCFGFLFIWKCKNDDHSLLRWKSRLWDLGFVHPQVILAQKWSFFPGNCKDRSYVPLICGL